MALISTPALGTERLLFWLKGSLTFGTVIHGPLVMKSAIFTGSLHYISGWQLFLTEVFTQLQDRNEGIYLVNMKIEQFKIYFSRHLQVDVLKSIEHRDLFDADIHSVLPGTLQMIHSTPIHLNELKSSKKKKSNVNTCKHTFQMNYITTLPFISAVIHSIIRTIKFAAV